MLNLLCISCAIANKAANIPESARQKRIAERNEKREAGLLKRGRPSVAGSKRQAVLAAREAKKAAGIEIKRGRPKVEKVEEATEVSE
mgnify:CR=1 FL=1